MLPSVLLVVSKLWDRNSSIEMEELFLSQKYLKIVCFVACAHTEYLESHHNS